MEIYSIKFAGAVQSLLYIRYCQEYNLEQKDKVKITSTSVAAAIGADATVIRLTLTSLNNLGYIQSKRGPGNISVNVDMFSKTLVELFDDLNEEENRTLFNIYVPYSDSNKAVNKINSTLSGRFQRSTNILFEDLDKTTLDDLYQKCFPSNKI